MASQVSASYGLLTIISVRLISNFTECLSTAANFEKIFSVSHKNTFRKALFCRIFAFEKVLFEVSRGHGTSSQSLITEKEKESLYIALNLIPKESPPHYSIHIFLFTPLWNVEHHILITFETKRVNDIQKLPIKRISEE